MKTILKLSILCASMLLSSNIIAQKINQQAKIKTPIKTKVKLAERKCNPLNIKSTENILRDKIGRSLKIYLDRDYGYVEVMGKKQNIRFGEYKVKKPGNNWLYYLNDVKSQITRVKYDKKMFYLTVEFEKDKSEIKGKCPGCRVGKDKRAPDVNWQDPKVRVALRPVAHNGSFTFEVVRVDLMGKFKLNGPTEKFFPSISRYFKSLIADKVKKGIKSALDNDRIKNTIASAFKSEVNRLKIGQVKSIDFSKTNIYLCNY